MKQTLLFLSIFFILFKSQVSFASDYKHPPATGLVVCTVNSDTLFDEAEEYFRMDSVQLALNGDGTNPGFVKIISNYGGTKPGKLAKFYAGASYLKMGDFPNAIKYLKDFSTSDKLVGIRAAGLLGDAYAETGKKKEAVEALLKG